MQEATYILLICLCITIWFAFNWKDTLKDQHCREKNRQWKKKLSKFKKEHPNVDTSKPKYKIKKNR